MTSAQNTQTIELYTGWCARGRATIARPQTYDLFLVWGYYPLPNEEVIQSQILAPCQWFQVVATNLWWISLTDTDLLPQTYKLYYRYCLWFSHIYLWSIFSMYTFDCLWVFSLLFCDMVLWSVFSLLSMTRLKWWAQMKIRSPFWNGVGFLEIRILK